MSELSYSPEEMMVVAASRLLDPDDVVFIGIGLPSKAANLARQTHAPELSMIYESGTIDTKPTVLPLSIGDPELSRTAKAVVSVPEMFNYWLQGGWIRTGFLGAAQIDRFANLNSTVIGDYRKPKVRLPGAGGAPEIANFCNRTLVLLRQNPRTFVEKLDFMTTVGMLHGGKSRQGLNVPGRGPQAVITDLGILEPDAENGELVLTHLHPGVSAEAAIESTSWPLKVADQLVETEKPSTKQLEILRALVPSEESNVAELIPSTADLE
ncbi:MAG: CoA-transferase subunit beta [Acidobacteriota bacterium]|jgi:glutaconate CoA-transferase subunit B|nr:CoA-transferase subunit beta [Acidobacteriota bacterium]